jgi:pilus assembly protein CpaC
MDCNQLPRRLPGQETRAPDDYELFLEGILEAPRGQRKVWNGRCYNAAWKCDPTANRYPCVGNVCYGPNGTMLPGGACGPAGCAPALPAGPGHAIRVMPAPTTAPAAAAAAPMTVTVPVQAAPPVTPVSAPDVAPQPVTMPLAPAFPATLPAVPGVPVDTTEPAVLPAAPADPAR